MQPTIFVRNTTGRNVLAEIVMSWRGDSGKGQVELPNLQLAPFATQELQIWAKQKQLGIPEDAHWALVALTTTAAPDDVIAIASSRDCNGVYNVETQFTSGMGSHYAGAEWQTDATHNQIAAITNVGEEPADALLTLRYDKGVRSYELQQSIAPGDQMWVNLAELIRQHVPDRNGTFLPVDVSAVTYDLQDLTPGAHSLIVNSLAVNSVTGRAVPNCPQCCPFYDIAFSPQDLFLQIQQQYPLLIDGLDGCNNSIYDLDPYFQNWSPSNTSIVTVTSNGQAQAVGVGTTPVLATGSVPEPGPCGCSYSFKEPQTQISVRPVITSFNPTFLNAGDNQKSLTINGRGFGSSPTVQLPSGVTLDSTNQTTASDNQIQFSAVNVAPSAYIGINSMTVTANGQQSDPALFTIDGPDHMIVKGDVLGSIGPNVSRVVTFQIMNEFSGTPVFVIPIGEVPSRSGWTCNQSEPGIITTPCSQGVDTDTNGMFQDEWDIGSGSYTPAGCGWNFTTHWQWCSAPKWVGTLTGSSHTDAVSENGVINPPNHFSLNAPVYP